MAKATLNQNKYVCWDCRTARRVGDISRLAGGAFGYAFICPTCGKDLTHLHYTVKVPASDDDHRGWKTLQEEQTRPPGRRRRRRPRRKAHPLADWERELLRST